MKMKNRILSFLLAVVMLLSFAIPAAAFDSLSEVTNVTDYGDASSEESSSSNTNSSSSEPSSDSQEVPSDTESSSASTESSSLTEEMLDKPLLDSGNPPDTFTFEALSTSRSRSSAPLFINMKTEPNIPFKYPFSGGTSTFSSYIYYTSDGRIAYCIEPSRFDSNHGTIITGEMTYDGLSIEKQRAITRVIASNSHPHTDHSYYMAAQVLIWEIALGQPHKSGNVYSAVVIPNASQLSAPYEDLLRKLDQQGEIPSFMSRDITNPTRHEMTEAGGKWSINLKNTNSKVVLDAIAFKSKLPFDFKASGNTLTVTANSEPNSDSLTAWRGGNEGSGLIFWSSTEQTKASFADAAGVPVDAYMVFSDNYNPPSDEGEGEKQAVGYLTIYKYDGKTNLPLGGAVFKVQCEGFRDDGFSVPYGGGTVVIPMPKGKDSVEVTVTEITGPDGYVKDPAAKTVTVTAGDIVNIAEVSFVNYPADCSLTIYKHERGKKDVALQGARFRIRYSDPAVNAKVWTETTDANGEIFIQLPAAGTLIIEELEAPAGYVMGAITTHDVTVAKGEDKHIDISNDKKSELIAIKKDAQTGQLLAGAVIRATLLRSNTEPHEGGQVYTQTTGADGRAVFSNLIPGEYRVEEIQPPQYYVLNDTTVHTVNVLDGNSEIVTVEFLNEPWTGLTIRKVDAADGHGLQGAIFELYRGTEVHPTDYLGDWQTNENGTVVIQKLEPGYYTIREAQAPYGYLLDPDHTVQTIEIKPDAVQKNITIIFRNPPKPKILIAKVDADTGVYLPGAVFHVAKRDSAEYTEVTTGSDGTVLLENLDEEWYTITEIRAPNGYVLDATPRNIQAVAGKTVTVTVNNGQEPDLILRKIDEATGKGLAGAVFRVTKDGAKEYQDVTTNANGTFQVLNLTPGWYIVSELQAPDGYILDETPHYIEVKAGKDTELVIKNQHKPSLKIVKIDSVTRQPLAAAKFKISMKNGKVLGEYTSDMNGEILLEDIEPALYVIEEIKAPDGYLILDAQKEALVEWGKTTTVAFDNQPENPILIKKVDAKTGEPLPGAKFLVQKVNGELVGEYETGRNGYITVTGIEPGFYTVKETKAPLGYILDDTPKTVELKYDEPAIVEFENQPLNGLHLLKVDSKTKAPLAGAKFRISEKGGKEIGTFTTDGQGEILVDGLEPGWYTCEELSAPAGYLLDNAPKDVEFVWGQLTTVEFENELLSPIQIKKVDEETGAPLAGALFKITKANGEFVGEFSSGADGFINVPELSPGFYTVSEQRAPDGYLLDSTPKTIEVKANVPTLVEFTNKRMPGVQVRKLDKVSGEPIGGAKFRVTKMSGELIGDFQTNSAGFFVVPEQNLNNEWITVYETQAAAGYILDPTPQNVQLKPGKTAIVEFLNQPLVGLQIKKVDDVTGLPMGGVQFKVSELDGRSIGSFTTDDTGLIFVPNLKSGAWVIVEELKTLPGYRLDNAPRNVEIKGDRLNILEYRNQPFPNLLIKKVDAETGKALEGVKFKLYDKLNRELGVFTTSQLGQIHLTGMEAGTYYLQEVETKPGYVLDATVREISLLWGKTTTIEVKNTPMGTLRVKKIDAISKKPIYGVTFNLYDLKNNLLGEYTTDNNGVIEFPKEITAGKYKLKEVKAALNYVLDDVPRTIEVKAGETTEIIIENQPVLGKIQIIKKSAEYNDVSKKGKGAYLAGAVFEIFDSRNKVVDRITTDSRGIATSKDLPAGEIFGVREITAPDYYLLNEQVFYAEVKKPNDIIQFEVLDANEKFSVNVEKYGNIECMPGDVIRYDFEEISNTSTVALDEFYWRDTIPTDAVRIEKIYTGTWSEHLDYKVLYKTNRKGWRTLEDDIYSGSADTLDCSRSALRLGANEVVTEIKFEFGTVQAGFEQVDAPYILCSVNGDLPNEYRFTNKTDVGGKRADKWVIAKDSWVTIVYAKPRGKLPLTGK